MPGLIIHGNEFQVSGLKILNWKDDERLRRGPEDGAKRTTNWIRQIIVHTTKGIPSGSKKTPQVIITGSGPDSGKEFFVNKFWTKSAKQSGAHLIIDTDGSVGCIADLYTEKMYHAGQKRINDRSVGIEIYQLSDGQIYEESLNSCIKLCDFICRYFGIQKQIHLPYSNKPVRRLSKGGLDCVGIFGHRDVTSNRGEGDPGNPIMDLLVKSGWEKFNFEEEQDLNTWKERQKDLGLIPDGVAGPKTVKALKDKGYEEGLWGHPKREEPVINIPVINIEDFEDVENKENWIVNLLRRIFNVLSFK